MAIKAGELVVEIFVKGKDEAAKALKSTKDWLTDVSNEGLATKAAIVAAIASAERFISSALNTANTLHQFGVKTGLSTERLQQWQYAMGQSGISAEQTQSAIEGLQNVLGQMYLTKKPPEGWNVFTKTLAHPIDFKKLTGPQGTDYGLELAREYVKKAKETGQDIKVTNAVLKNLGLEPIITGLREFHGDISKMDKGIGTRTQKDLQQVNRELFNLHWSWEKWKADVTATYAIPFLKSVRQALEGISVLIGVVTKRVDDLATRFRWVKTLLDSIASFFKFVFRWSPIGLMKEIGKMKEGVPGAGKYILEAGKSFQDFIMSPWGKLAMGQYPMTIGQATGLAKEGIKKLPGAASNLAGMAKENIKGLVSGLSDVLNSPISVAPVTAMVKSSMPAPVATNSKVVNNTSTVNYAAQYHGTQSPEEHSDHVSRHIKRAFGQTNTRRQN
jgi:hypothetical protein